MRQLEGTIRVEALPQGVRLVIETPHGETFAIEQSPEQARLHRDAMDSAVDGLQRATPRAPLPAQAPAPEPAPTAPKANATKPRAKK